MAGKSRLPQVWQVPQEFHDRLGEEAGRQRAMFAEGHLLLVLHAVASLDDDRREGSFFWRKPDGAWSSDALGSGINALDRHLSQFEQAIDRYEEQEEHATGADDYFAVLRGMAPMHRAATHLRETLQQARELVRDDRDIIVLRDRAVNIERAAELLYNDAKNGLDVAIARRAEEQARSSHRMAISAHRLNLLAAFFFPIATLAALFGMNLTHGLESAAAPWAFLSVLAAGLVLGRLVQFFVTSPARKPGPPSRSGHADRRSAASLRTKDAPDRPATRSPRGA